jgi:site-specific DNA-methyltransferase (adenine-specific)
MHPFDPQTIQRAQMIHGDCLDVLRLLPPDSVDAIVTDPPYGLSFMGKKWDYDVPRVDVWRECLRVLKPGGHLLAFAGTRTQHRMVVNIEDAGFEIRDMIAWVYGSGFPKSLDVSKAIDKEAGAERTEVVGKSNRCIGPSQAGDNGIGTFKEYNWQTSNLITAPATDAAKQWSGWGTALKPAMEPITVARKPLIGTVAENVLAHGTGALNIDGCRVPTDDKHGGGAEKETTPEQKGNEGWTRPWMENEAAREAHAARVRSNVERAEALGRWPANLIHDGSDEVVGLFPVANGGDKRGKCNGARPSGFANVGADSGDGSPCGQTYADEGSAARFFYCAKANKKDRSEYNHHETVKPTDLMRYLCRLVTPPGGVILDPFTGSGSTGKAAMLESFRFLGIEREAAYVEIAQARIGAVL